MLFSPRLFRRAAVFVTGIFAAMPLATVLLTVTNARPNQEKRVDPWNDSQLLHPAELARELGAAKGRSAPTIVYVGFRILFEGGHIPGASFHGTASKEDGLADLKKWVARLPRSENLVIYCGCCPFDHCPNIRPAYTALHEMGFTRVRILLLPTSFAADWVEKGYPIESGI